MINKMSLTLAFLLSILVTGSLQAQYNVHQKHPIDLKTNWKKTVFVPSILITAGLVATTDNEVFDKFEVREERNEWMPTFRTHVDDYLQYAPIAAVYGLNALGIKGKNDFANRTALLIKSELIMVAMVVPLKRLTAVPRPDSGVPNSFPSGHTAQAFAAATFLSKEYGHDHPMISVMGYAAATGVGVLRVMNNRHWVSDVLVGAGIGILSTNLAYLTHQYKWGNKKSTSASKRKTSMILTPTIGQQTYGMNVVLNLQ